MSRYIKKMWYSLFHSLFRFCFKATKYTSVKYTYTDSYITQSLLRFCSILCFSYIFYQQIKLYK
nr:MAG TPA: hypothetical protein [Caudoviricetes sp.]